MDLGMVMRAARRDAGLTQRAVAHKAGVTAHALSRWETGARPVRSDDAERVLAACDRDVRFVIVSRMADVVDALEELAGMPLSRRLSALGILSESPLTALQATGAVTFTGAWAAAALGLPTLHDCGGMLITGNAAAQAAVAAVLRPLAVVRLAPGGPWSVVWNDEVFSRNPQGRYSSAVLGTFTADITEQSVPELNVATELGRWRICPPAELVPQTVDQDALDCWQSRAT